MFDVQPDCSVEELQRAARTSVALDRLAEEHDLGSLAYYYMGQGNAENEDAISSIILGNSLLTARGIPVAGEYEIKNAQAMKIMDSFGAGGSFTEYYAMDFKDDVVLMGHDGPGHIAIAEGKTKVRPLRIYHGKVGRRIGAGADPGDRQHQQPLSFFGGRAGICQSLELARPGASLRGGSGAHWGQDRQTRFAAGH